MKENASLCSGYPTSQTHSTGSCGDRQHQQAQKGIREIHEKVHKQILKETGGMSPLIQHLGMILWERTAESNQACIFSLNSILYCHLLLPFLEKDYCMQQWSGNILGSLIIIVKLLTNINVGLGIPQVLLLIKHKVIIKLPVKEGDVFSHPIFFLYLD